MRDLQGAAIIDANLTDELVDLVWAHQLDWHMLCRRALEHRAERVDMADMGGDDALDVRLYGEAAQIRRAGVREGPDAGLFTVLDELVGERALVDQQICALRELRDALARLGIAAEDDDLALRLDAKAKAGRNIRRNMVDGLGADLDVLVLENDARFVFGDVGPDRFDIGLARRIGGARPDVGIERAALEQVSRPCCWYRRDRESASAPLRPSIQLEITKNGSSQTWS